MTRSYVLCLFGYAFHMVGPPKTLYDLRKIEGAVRVTCRDCKRVTLHDREEMIQMRHVAREGCDWPVVSRSMRCGHCVSQNVKVEIEAFGQGLPELRQRRAALITIELALIILRNASYSATRRAVPIEAVRLALRTLHPYLRDRAALERFWERYAVAEPAIAESPAHNYHDMVRTLVTRGYAIPAELR